jgi:glycosyltransferase involved in cell wall biosynthesis
VTAAGAGPAALVVIPRGLPATAGNRVTAERMARYLADLGWRCRVVEADRALCPPPGCRVVHALHALNAGPSALEAARRHGLPLVVTITGTDLNEGDRSLLAQVLAAAAAVVVYHDAARAELVAGTGLDGRRVAVIPPGVEAAPPAPRRRSAWGWRRHDFVFLLPAALRRTKDPAFALEPLERLARRDGRVRFALAGPVRETEAAEGVLAAMAGRPWATYLGEVPRWRMPELYRTADVVLNTSRSEGLANAVLEAMAAGRPVLARNITGNRAAVRHGRDGLLFADADEFLHWAERLMADPHLRRRLGRSARRTVIRRFDPRKEAAAHVELYGAVERARPVHRAPYREEASRAACR